MQIVINISDSIYKDLQLGIGVGVVLKLEDIVVLPKGHGRLIDADAAKCPSCDKFGCANSDICSLYNAQTIIDADTGGE